jgi:hypothetical protein
MDVAACKPTIQRRNSELINVGIDVGKRSCQAALKGDDGRVLDELRFENTNRGVQELLEHITVHNGERSRTRINRKLLDPHT